MRRAGESRRLVIGIGFLLCCGALAGNRSAAQPRTTVTPPGTLQAPATEKAQQHEGDDGHEHAAPGVNAALKPEVIRVARQLLCDCPDCGRQSLDQCPDCTRGRELRTVIAELQADGKSDSQIIDHFAQTYGEHLLGQPRPRGFGRLAATVPAAAIILGLVPVALLLRNRRRIARLPAVLENVVPANTTADAAGDDARLRRALEEFRG